MYRLVASATLFSVALGADFYFAGNNNWDNAVNWKDGTVPAPGAAIKFTDGADPESGIPGCLASFGEQGGSVKVGQDSGSLSVSSMTLPENGKLILANDLTISFTEETPETP